MIVCMGILIEKSGNLFHSAVDAIGQGINIEGVMGAGIAKTFASTYPEMLKEYVALCRQKKIQVGTAWVWRDSQSDDIVLNIASQDLRGKNARIEWLESGVLDAISQLRAVEETRVIALPKIGCGIGGLEWDDVRLVLNQIAQTEDIDIEVWAFDF